MNAVLKLTLKRGRISQRHIHYDGGGLMNQDTLALWRGVNYSKKHTAWQMEIIHPRYIQYGGGGFVSDRGSLNYLDFGPAAAGRVYMCGRGEEAHPWTPCPLILATLAVGIQGAWRQPWPHSGCTTAGPGYRQIGCVVFDDAI